MQQMGYPHNAYGAQAVMTASPVELVAKLYEAAITNLRKAIACIEAGDVEGRWKANRKTFDILEHLTLTLNTEQGGEIAKNLSELYTFMMRQLIEVDVNNDVAAAQNVITLLEPIQKSWRELANRQAAEASGGAPRQPNATDGTTATPPGDRIAATA